MSLKDRHQELCHYLLGRRSATNLREWEAVSAVNDWFNNNIAYERDPNRDERPEKDYWQSLNETLLWEKGDCEDIAIAKYFTLLQMGIPRERMRIRGMIFVESNQSHMVLTVTNVTEPGFWFFRKPTRYRMAVLDNIERVIVDFKQGSHIPTNRVYGLDIDSNNSKWNSMVKRHYGTI